MDERRSTYWIIAAIAGLGFFWGFVAGWCGRMIWVVLR